MIWGSSFFLLFIFLLLLAFIQYVILKKTLRKNLPDFPMPVSVNSGEKISLSLEVYIPLLLPGFRCLWKTELIWERGKRILTASTPLQRGGSLYDIYFLKTLRGLYKGDSGMILLEDLFGFTRFIVFRGEPVTLSVFPEFETDGIKRKKSISGGEEATADPSRVRSYELLEVRKYYPGDDARRINWKMFAASGQLFLRIGEEIPPPSGEVTVVLNSFSQSIDSLHRSSYYTDLLISAFLSFIYAFIEKGCIVNSMAPGMRDPLVFNPGKPDELFRILSSVTAGDRINDYPDGNFFYIISHPQSDSLRDIIDIRGGERKIFIKKIPPLTRKQYAKGLFMRDSICDQVSFREYRALIQIHKSAEEDLMYLKHRGKGRIHGEII